MNMKRNPLLIILCLMLFFIPGGYAALSDNNILCYDFEETSGTTAVDFNNTLNLTITGATVNQSGKVGKAYNFDGNGDTLQFPNSRLLDFRNNNFTISGWYKIDDGDVQGIFGGQADLQFGFIWGQGGVGNFYGFASTTGSSWDIMTDNMVTQSEIIGDYVLMTFRRNGSNFSYYTNTTYKFSKSFAVGNGSIMWRSNSYYIGRKWDASTNFDGSVDSWMYWNRSLSDAEIDQVYNSGTGINCSILYPGVAPPPSPIITFNKQSPTDINFTNVFPNPVNVTYNTTYFLSTDVMLQYMLNSTNIGTSCIIFKNGSCNATNGTYYPLNYTEFYGNSSDAMYGWSLRENIFLPSDYPFPDQGGMEISAKQQWNLSSSSDMARLNIKNVSSSIKYGVFEVYVNSSGSNSRPLSVWYCNSSYVTGDPGLSPNCVDFYDINDTFSYNHNHSGKSFHVVAPFPVISNKTLGLIQVTSVSSFLLTRSVSAGTWKVYYITNTTYPGSWQASADKGLSYVNQSTSVDYHLHQIDNMTSLCYKANSTLSSAQSVSRCDNLDVTPMPPSAVVFTKPYQNNTYVVSTSMEINYSAAQSVDSAITGYFLYLCDIDGNNISDIADRHLNLSYDWNGTASQADGNYTICVRTTAANGLTSLTISPMFMIDNTPPVFIWMFPANDNTSIGYLNQTQTMDVTLIDQNLYAYELVITGPGMTVVYNATSSGITPGSYHVVNQWIPPYLGVYTVNLTASDSHTKTSWNPETTISNDKNKMLKFTFYKENETDLIEDNVSIEYDGPYTIDDITTSKIKDRYTMTYKYNLKTDNGLLKIHHRYIIRCSEPVLMRGSKYPGHVLCLGPKIWVDFNNPNVLASKLTKCGPDCVKVDLDMRPNSTVTFESIGGINIRSEIVRMNITVAPAPNSSAILMLETCPAELVGQISLYAIIAVLLTISIIGLRYRMGILATFSGLGILGMSFVIYGCFIMAGLVIGFLGFLIFILSFTRKLF